MDTIKLYYHTYNEAFKYLRQAMGLSQAELAEFTGIPARRIQYIERSIDAPISIDEAQKMLKILMPLNTPRMDMIFEIMDIITQECQERKEEKVQEAIEQIRGIDDPLSVDVPEWIREDVQRYFIQNKKEK